MPNYQDDPHYQGQQSQGREPYLTPPSGQPQRPAGKGPSRPRQVASYPNPPRQGAGDRYPMPGEQQPLVLKSLAQQPQQPLPTYTETAETLRQPLMPEVAAPAPAVEVRSVMPSPVRKALTQRSEPLDTLDYILMGLIAVLAIAIIIVGVFIIREIGAGHTFSLNNLRLLPFYFLVYLLCIGGGILWGRYQLDTGAKKANVQLSKQVNDLRLELNTARNENGRLQGELVAAQAAVGGSRTAQKSPPYAPPTGRSPSRPLPDVVVKPDPISVIKPGVSIYDVVREPDDYNPREQQEHPHEKYYPPAGTSLQLSSGWQVIGASRRGYGHSYEGKYRDDDFDVRVLRDKHNRLEAVMVAIADGVSSKPLSRRGARAAVQGALSIQEFVVKDLLGIVAQGASSRQLESPATAVLMNALQSAHTAVELQAQKDSIRVDDLQSTLLVFLAVPLEQQVFVASVQIGDGALFARQLTDGRTPSESWGWLQQPQIQTTGNEVIPFMRTEPGLWKTHVRFALLQSPAFIMGMTDGIADDMEPPPPTHGYPQPDEFVKVEDFYQQFIVKDVLSSPQPASALLQSIAYRKKRSFDDRTIVCLYHL